MSANLSQPMEKALGLLRENRQKIQEQVLNLLLYSKNGLEGIRTPDPLVRSQMLYPLSYKPSFT